MRSAPRWVLVVTVAADLAGVAGCRAFLKTCGENEVERDGECRRQCNNSFECAGGEVCADGVCAPDNNTASSGSSRATSGPRSSSAAAAPSSAALSSASSSAVVVSSSAAPSSAAVSSAGASSSSAGTSASESASGSSSALASSVAGSGNASSRAAAASSVAGTSSGGCGRTVPIDADSVFVAAAGTDVSNCGPKAVPCRTIGYAMSQATTFGFTRVYVERGTYTENLTARAGLVVEGGLNIVGTTWVPGCVTPRDLTVVIGTGSASATLSATDLMGTAEFRYMTIRTKPTAAAGESLYAVAATGPMTVLSLDHVKVVSEAAGAGATGSVGNTGTAGPLTCSADGDGTSSTLAGPGGNGAAAGSFNQAAYAAPPATAGGAGLAPGNNGAAGQEECQSSIGCESFCAYTCTNSTPTNVCAAGGARGCGGRPGDGGAPGGAGGSSVAVFAWAATVDLTSSVLTAGNGGNGGAGGGAGPGGPGRAGGAGQTELYGTGCTSSGSVCMTNRWECVPDFASVSGSPGTDGGRGAPGGMGGSGAGGWSVGVVRGGGATVSLDVDTNVAVGLPGTGPGTGGAKGADGTAALTVTP